MKVYYAHCQAIYGTPQEQRDVAMLESLGFTVVNPSAPEHAEAAKRIKAAEEEKRSKMPTEHQPSCAMRGSEKVMEYFTKLVEVCDAVAFRALPDGAIPAGVAKEIDIAMKGNKPVFELPSCILRRVISVEQTREYLKEVGQR